MLKTFSFRFKLVSALISMVFLALVPSAANAGPASMTVTCSYSTSTDTISVSVQNAPGGTDYVRYVIEVVNLNTSSFEYLEPYFFNKPSYSGLLFYTLVDSQIYPTAYQAYAVGKNGVNKKGMPKTGACIQVL
jgi:hypothetical protein